MKILIGILTFILLFVGCREDIVEFSDIDKTGTLYVNSDPDGAEIFLNDIRVYKITPDSLMNLQPGNYNIRLRLAGYPDESTNIAVISGQKRFVNINFGKTQTSN
ncbi:MAG: PEGA domain-containing protein [Bacteroidota bacterium]